MTTESLQHPPAAAKGGSLPAKVLIRGLNFYYGQSRALKERHVVAVRRQGDRVHRPLGLRQVDAAARAQPHVRPLPRTARRGRGAARRREHPRRRTSTSICCARGSAWCSRSRRRSRCRSTTTSPSASGSTRSCRSPSWTSASKSSLRRAALWDEVKDKLQRQRPRPLRRPAAAAVHRAHRRDQAGSDPARRAVLGARSDLDRQDRGTDRRAERRLHDRHRHPQHAAGGARLAVHRLHVSRRDGRVRRHQAKSSPRRATSAPRTTSPAASAEGEGAMVDHTVRSPTTRNSTPSNGGSPKWAASPRRW